jgi:hypothetical protein
MTIAPASTRNRSQVVGRDDLPSGEDKILGGKEGSRLYNGDEEDNPANILPVALVAEAHVLGDIGRDGGSVGTKAVLDLDDVVVTSKLFAEQTHSDVRQRKSTEQPHPTNRDLRSLNSHAVQVNEETVSVKEMNV